MAYKATRRICSVCHEDKVIETNREICEYCRRFIGEVKRGVIREPDYKEVNTQNYKEPMTKVEDGFGYYGAITETNDGAQIQCHICGYYFGNLGSHIVRKHHIKARDYKLTYGLRIREGLVSPALRKIMQEKYNEYARKTPEEYAEMSAKGQLVIAERGIKRGGDMWTAQTRNEKGLCKEQTIAKIRKVAELEGGYPTYNTYAATFGGLDVVMHWFGTWNNAVKEAGCQTYAEHRDNNDRDLKEKILSDFYTFYVENGRTPQSSDLTAKDMVPFKTVLRLYGTMNDARFNAGVPLLIYERGKWVEREFEEPVNKYGMKV